jgi:hypothetical protein
MLFAHVNRRKPRMPPSTGCGNIDDLSCVESLVMWGRAMSLPF